MTRLDIISSPQPLDGLGDTIKIFCAGPIQGAPDWQHSLPAIKGVTWICPRRENYENFDYDQQTSWETLGLRISDSVMFWIPAPKEDIQGRSYAQTTRIEFGECLGRKKTVFIGIYPDYPGRQYFQNKLSEYNKAQKVHKNLNDLLGEVQEWVSNRKPGIFFTSDTHFSQERTLLLSKRPFNSVSDMDWTMIERWNQKVPPGSTVYHLGDFGEYWPLDYLNGNIKLILGNYEFQDKKELPDICILGDIWNQIIDETKVWMSHEPLKIKEMEGFKLFGHIHGRQMVKPWNGVDVGVDCHNYTPCS